MDVEWNEDLDSFVVQTSWLGFADAEDTWEPFKSLLDQVPLLLLQFLDELGQRNEPFLMQYGNWITEHCLCDPVEEV